VRVGRGATRAPAAAHAFPSTGGGRLRALANSLKPTSKPLAALLLLTSITATAVAQEQAPSPAPPPAPAQKAADEARARALYAEGKKHYDVGEYGPAIEAWKQAYLLVAAPMLLFNIGQAYRLSGSCAQAMRFYASYEREANPVTNQAELDQAKERCNPAPTNANTPPIPPDSEPRAATATPPAGEPGATSSAEPDLELDGPPDSEADGRATDPASAALSADNGHARPRYRTAAYASAGAGVALVAVSLYLGKVAGDDAGEVEDYHGEWDSERQDLEERGQRAGTWSIVTGIAGAVGIAAGGALYFLGRPDADGGAGVAVTPSGAEMTWTRSF
jgi:tetratricopeptide (TPR) repeat protein